MILFDYIFYRIAKFFYRKDGIDAIRAVLLVSAIQVSLIELLSILIIELAKRNENKAELECYGQVGVMLAILFMILNYFRYKGRYWILAEKWRNKEKVFNYRLNGLLVVMAVLSPLIFLFLIAYILHILS